MSGPPAATELDRALLAAARDGSEGAFARLAEPYRRELHVHCYRLLGSFHDAEDALQETLLRAWRQLGSYEERGPLRAWLYRIATNVCLTMLERRRRQPEPVADPADETLCLTPYPDQLLAEIEPGLRAETRERLELALQAALLTLPPLQRAALVLREALDWSATEIADQLGTTVAGANSALQRARASIDRSSPLPRHVPASSEAQRRTLDRLVAAWNAVDLDAFVSLLAEDVVVTMPPEPLRLQGRAAAGEFFATVPADGRLDRIRLVATSANGQPALAAYPLDEDGVHRAYGIMVLALAGDEVAAIVGFVDAGLFPEFGLPGTLEL